MEYLNLGERVLEGLSGSFTVKKLDIGRCASLSKKGMTFFTETLYAKGGPAVDRVKKLFGDEIAGELIIEHMYGC